MELLYWFESIRTPVLDTVMSLVTRLGEETFFMIAALFVFWCWDKRRGYYLLAVGFAGTLASQWLKIACRVPRPWVIDPDFTIVESAREAATGYSFPSGHTQCAVGYLGGIARFTGRLWVRVVCIVLALLVAVSRMYLGVHTPADVGVSLLISLVLVLALYPLLESTLWFPNRMYAIIGVMLALSLAFVGYMELLTQPLWAALRRCWRPMRTGRRPGTTPTPWRAPWLASWWSTPLTPSSSSFPPGPPGGGSSSSWRGAWPWCWRCGSCCGSHCWPSAAATPWPGACATS